MYIALDWDETFTRDPVLWVRFVRSAKERGHIVKIVTMRFDRETADIREILNRNDLDIAIIATGREQKRPFCDALGWHPHVWIDDTPEFIVAPVTIIGANKEEKCTDS